MSGAAAVAPGPAGVSVLSLWLLNKNSQPPHENEAPGG